MRKIITFVVALLTALATVLQDQLGITIGLTAAMASLAALLVYIFGEAKNDLKRIIASATQGGKWTDPTFWGAMLAGVLPVINATFKLGLSPEFITAIVSVVIAVLGAVFAKRQKSI